MIKIPFMLSSCCRSASAEFFINCALERTACTLCDRLLIRFETSIKLRMSEGLLIGVRTVETNRKCCFGSGMASECA